LLTDLDETSILYRGSSIDASFKVSVHLTKRFQRRFLEIDQPETATDRVHTVSVTTIEDTKTGPLSLTVTTDRVHTVSVTTIEDTKTEPLSMVVILTV
jgi:hypothetical protein